MILNILKLFGTTIGVANGAAKMALGHPPQAPYRQGVVWHLLQQLGLVGHNGWGIWGYNGTSGSNGVNDTRHSLGKDTALIDRIANDAANYRNQQPIRK